MINRYLGNKTGLLAPIVEIVKAHCSPEASVCDIFAGTMSVALELKQQGYNVIANDINLFSAIIGHAFLVNNEIPPVNLELLFPPSVSKSLYQEAYSWASSLVGVPGFSFLEHEGRRTRYVRLLSVLVYLQNLNSECVPSDWRRTDFFDAYTESGGNSAYVSQRGRQGRRRFFSEENGRRIDAILNQLRYWRYKKLLEDATYTTLLSLLLRAVEKISNTQGTYHDFPREEIDARALNALRFEAPPLDVTLRGGNHMIGREEDSLEFIRRVPSHELLYIDPPYNFRQYTSYYFMLNLISRYPELEDPGQYFANIQYVRGQNMTHDFTSTFCKRSLFLSSLRTLIERADTRTVVLSYFDGKNHWGDFKQGANGVGYQKITEFFASDLFEPRSLKVVPVPRTNYQSYGGYKAREVLEYLFIAKKRRR